ncbi:MAG: DNA topoisomerase, partial [Eubacteriales bacterium]|nr:DNA topoisomerase [Eubacteriales bacterium]
SRYLSFTSRRTMVVAQQLYEGLDLPKIGTTALVTYIRTDSVRVSTEAEQEARQYITRVFGEAYLPKTANHYRNRNASQDAHEAIRPAHFDLPPEQIRDQLSNDQYRLYKLIWDKFMSSQMAPAQVDTVTADIEANGQIFRVSGETIVFPGYLAQYGVQLVDQEAEKPADDEDDSKNRLPELAEGDELMLNRLTSEQKFTLPPPRYTEATLIRAMEEKGIGRPSTYAPTISTILDRFYVEKEQRFLKPTELGKAVTGMLEEQFDDIVDLAFTADMEERLDTVESGEVDWVRILDQFYPPFHQKVQNATETMERVKIAVTPTGESCPECNDGDLVIKEGRFGKFIACSNYPECKYTRNIENAVKGVCPLCGSGLVSRVSKKYRGSRFYTCDRKGKDPECAFISWDIPIEDSHCETCGSYMVWKRYRGRTFPKCGNRDCPTNEKRRKKDDSGDDTAAAAAAGDKAVTAKKPAAKKTAATKRSATTTAKKSITAKKVTTAKKSTTAKKPTTAKKTTAAKKATTAKKAAGTKKKKTTEPVVPDVSSGEGETL